MEKYTVFNFYLHVLFYPFWKLYLISGVIGSIVSGLLLLEQKGTIELFEMESGSDFNLIIMIFGLITFLNGTRTGLLTFLKHKSYIQVVSFFFNNVCLQKLEYWDQHYDKLELSKCIHTDISAFVDTTIKIYSIIIRNLISTFLLFYFLAIDRKEYILFALFICLARSYFLELLVKFWEKKNDRVREIKTTTEKHLTEFVMNNTSMQLYGLTTVYHKFVKESLLEYNQAQIDDSLWYAIFMFCFLFLIRFIDIGVYIITFSLEKIPNLIDIQITLNYFRLLSDSVQSLSDIQKEWKRNKDSVYRLSKYLYIKGTETTVSKSKRGYKIEFENITFSYPTRNSIVFENLNLKIEEGDLVAIIGDSGKGKTTLIKLLLGLYTPNEGRVLLGNEDTLNMKTNNLRKKICIVPQEPIVFENKTIRENLELFAKNGKVSNSKIEKVLKAVQLDDLISKLDTQLVALSGGQKQRLSIARILISKCPIIILDEAFSAMDARLKNKMTKLIFKFITKHNKTLILITHDSSITNVKEYDFKHINV